MNWDWLKLMVKPRGGVCLDEGKNPERAYWEQIHPAISDGRAIEGSNSLPTGGIEKDTIFLCFSFIWELSADNPVLLWRPVSAAESVHALR